MSALSREHGPSPIWLTFWSRCRDYFFLMSGIGVGRVRENVFVSRRRWWNDLLVLALRKWLAIVRAGWVLPGGVWGLSLRRAAPLFTFQRFVMPKGLFSSSPLAGRVPLCGKAQPRHGEAHSSINGDRVGAGKAARGCRGQSTMFARGERGRMWNDRLHNQRRVLRRSPAPLGNEPSFFLRTSRR